MNNDIKQAIKQALDEWSDAQVNLASDQMRVILTESIAKKVEPCMQQMIEDIICPESAHVVDH